MQLLCGLHGLQPLAGGRVATTSSLDDTCLGYQAILVRPRERPLELGVLSCMVIFEPQPHEFFPPDSASVRLTRPRGKLELLRGQGADVALCLALSRRLRELSAAEFIRQVLVGGLAVRHLEVGGDFRSGCSRSGDFTFLVNAGREQGFTVEAAATAELDGTRVNNTRIRQALAEDDLHLAGRLLGRPLSLSGRALYGQKLGRQLGSPMVNIQLKRRRTSLNGVHLVSTLVDGQRCQGVANIGIHPSVSGDGRPHPGVHPLDLVGDLYGRHLQVTSHQKLRDEQRSASLKALKAVVPADIAAAWAYWLG